MANFHRQACRDALEAHRAALTINPTLDKELMAQCKQTVHSDEFQAYCVTAFPKATKPVPPLMATHCLRKLHPRLTDAEYLQIRHEPIFAFKAAKVPAAAAQPAGLLRELMFYSRIPDLA